MAIQIARKTARNVASRHVPVFHMSVGVTLIMAMSWLMGISTAQAATPSQGDKIKSAFGVNIHLRERASASDWEDIMGQAESAGVQWGREQFNWDVIEPSNNDFSWDAYDAVVQSYEDHDIDVVGLLTYSSSWASSNSGASDSEFYPPDSTAWKNYVNKVAEHYSGSVNTWEIWNEPNDAGFWKGTQADYIQLFAAAADEIHSVNPNAQVVLGGLSGSDADWLDSFLAEIDDKSDIDIVAVHPYRVIDGNFNYKPEQTADGLNQLPVDLYNIKAVMARYGLEETPLWLTEAGWTTYSAGVSNKDQALYLIRLYTMALAIPQVEKVFWYTLFDSSNNESYQEAQFGLLNDDYTQKSSYLAYKYTKEHLQGQYFEDQQLSQRVIIDNFVESHKWHFENTECTEGTINDTFDSSLKVSYKFTGTDNCYAPVTLNGKMPDNTKALQFQAKGDNDDTALRVRVVDNTGETFQYNLGYLPNEWLFYNVQLSDWSAHWGGNDDGKFNYPLQFNSFVLDDTDGSEAEGVVYFDELYSTRRANTYLYRFHKGNYDMYAYWRSKGSKSMLVNLAGAGRIQEKRWRKSTKIRNSGNSIFRVKANESMRFLQTQ